MQDETWNTFKMVSVIASVIFLNVDMMWENVVFVTKNAKSSNWEMELAIVKQLLLDMNYSILVYSVFQLFRHLS